MGLFNRKNKVYSLPEAMKLLKTEKYEHYTTIPVENGYKLIPEAEITKNINNFKMNNANTYGRRTKFVNEISGNGAYKNNIVESKTNYNNWQSAKKYQKQFVRDLER